LKSAGVWLTFETRLTRYDNLFRNKFSLFDGLARRSDGRWRLRTLAVARAFLSAVAAFGHGEEIHGGLRNACRTTAATSHAEQAAKQLQETATVHSRNGQRHNAQNDFKHQN